jgi:hypothetical protein
MIQNRAANPLGKGVSPAWPSAQQIAQEQGNPPRQIIDLRICDSRDIARKSLRMADAALAATAFVDFAGASTHPGLVFSNTNFDVENITVAQNVSQTSTKASPVDWDCLGSVGEFLGTTLPADEKSCRLTQPALSKANYPTFFAQLEGKACRARGIVYGVPGKVQSAPGLALWIRTDNDFTPGTESPISEYLDYGSLEEGSYAEISVALVEGWSQSSANVSLNWVAEPEATSVNGELIALPPVIFERAGAGVVIYNPSVGGTKLYEHWLNTDVPAAFWSEVLPRIVGNRLLHLTIDIGTNGGGEDENFGAHMIELIGLVRAAVPTARIVIRTAYSGNADPPAGQKSYCNAIYDEVLPVIPSTLFVDTRGLLKRGREATAAGELGDGVHRTDPVGLSEQGRVIDAATEAIATHGQHACNFATDFETNPLRVGKYVEITGRCWPANERVEVRINGVTAGTAVGVDRTWTIGVTPTEAMRGDGNSVDVIAMPGGVAALATTRPTVISA